ncbi:MAG: hypothetical protein GX640_11695 [Fibrobacter sp.]|nr:hypothetical protein [Fibrobacter sp.]
MEKGIDFMEESLFSDTNDYGAQLLWPEAIVFGIGSTVSNDVKPVLIFDEHSCDKMTFDSCSDRVTKYIQITKNSNISPSILTILNEVSVIDRFGHVHPQHLHSLIKSLHNVRFLISKGESSSDEIRETLSPTWKRTLIDACITGMVYAIENDIDVIDDFAGKKEALQKSLKYYVEYTPHKANPLFEDARQQIATNFGNQRIVFKDAVLKDASGKVLLDSNGKPICQLLILSRICHACNAAWGEDITNILMMHFWEIEFQKQINFLTLINELDSSPLDSKPFEKRTTLGIIRRETLQKVEVRKEVFDHQTQKNKIVRRQASIWVLNIVQGVNSFNANQAALNFINSKNDGCGVLLLEDSSLGTKALFRANSFPVDIWKKIIGAVKTIEPQCWYDPSTDPSNPAPFINNGTKAHQYVQRSALDIYSLCRLIENILHNP